MALASSAASVLLDVKVFAVKKVSINFKGINCTLHIIPFPRTVFLNQWSGSHWKEGWLGGA
jgi:hypothetical protein